MRPLSSVFLLNERLTTSLPIRMNIMPIKRRGASGLVIDARDNMIAEYGKVSFSLLSCTKLIVPTVIKNV